jgi:hypothetical protein
MLGLRLRDEFKGERLKGTTIDFSADKTTGVLKKSAAGFLSVTYPSVDMLKVLEAAQPDKARPIVLLGGRGQGKSHLMAALYHAMKDPAAAAAWLADWAGKLNRPELTTLKFRSEVEVIAESLHLQRYKFLWELLFDRHPKGSYIKGKLGSGKELDQTILLLPGAATIFISPACAAPRFQATPRPLPRRWVLASVRRWTTMKPVSRTNHPAHVPRA